MKPSFSSSLSSSLCSFPLQEESITSVLTIPVVFKRSLVWNSSNCIDRQLIARHLCTGTTEKF